MIVGKAFQVNIKNVLILNIYHKSNKKVLDYM